MSDWMKMSTMSLIGKLQFKVKQQLILARQDLLKSFHGIDRTTLRGSRILVYHGVDEKDSRVYNTRFISQKRLANHIQEFQKYFNLVSVDSILNNEVDPEGFNLALMFDDGYKNNLSHALPVLEQYNVPATFCVTGVSDSSLPILWTDYLDIVATEYKSTLIIDEVEYDAKKNYPWSNKEYTSSEGVNLKHFVKRSSIGFIKKLIKELNRHVSIDQLTPYSLYWQQLTIDEIAQIADHPLIDVASHGYTHANLDSVSHSTACEEMYLSTDYLRTITKNQITSFVYPDGSYNTKLVDFGKSIGLAHHLIMNYADTDHASDPSIVPRLTINPYISTHNQIRAIIKGSYYGEV